MYDYLIITHLPAFYKVNLYNAIAKNQRILVVFLGKESSQRTKDFVRNDFHFDSIFLSQGNFESRNKFLSSLKLLKILFRVRYRRLLVGGWENPEFWLSVFLTEKQKNCLTLESSIYESKVVGWRAKVKKIFVSKIQTVFASGRSHRRLLEQLKFKGNIIETKGVGLINKIDRNNERNSYQKKFLFLGRLSREKNIDLLIEIFSKRQDLSLKIIGNGPLDKDIARKIFTKNISLVPHVENSQIGSIIQENNFLILPSYKEPWGLVVEEALYCNRPVIVSSYAGASEIIDNGVNGYIFDPYRKEELEWILEEINSVSYDKMLINIEKNGIQKRDSHQVNSYL